MEQTELSKPIQGRVGRAYGQVMRRTQSPREMELQVFAQVTAALEAVTETRMPGPRAEAIGRNRQLWDTLTWSVLDDSNALPVPVRAQIAGLGRWVNRESDRVLSKNEGLDSLIEINKIIMRGLQPADVEAPPCP